MNILSLDTRSTSDRTIVSLSDWGIHSVPVIGRYKYKSAREGLPDHSHEDMIEICYCSKGKQVYEVDGKTYHVKGGDVFVTFPNEAHGTGSHPEEKGVLYWMLLHVPRSQCFLQFTQHDSKIFVQNLLSLPSRHFKGNRDIARLLERIMLVADEKNVDKHWQKIIIENLIVSWLLEVIALAAPQSSGHQATSVNAVTIEKFIADHYKEPLSIQTMAALLHLSESRFKTWFKNEFGIPPLEYVLRRRIEEAKRVLKLRSGSDIASIAYDLGFSSPQHFATVFKRYTCLSPGEFRKTMVE